MPKKLIWSVGVAAALVVAIIASVTLLTPPVLTQTADSKPATTAQVADVKATAYAMVSIDINPSFELYLDKPVADGGVVVEIEAANRDAAELKKSNKEAFKALIGQPLGEVSTALIALAKDAGFITEPEDQSEVQIKVLVSTVILDEEDPDAEANQDSIGAAIKEALSVPGNEDLPKVAIIKATLREKFEAEGKDIPLGLYILKGMYTETTTDENGKITIVKEMKVSDYVKDPELLAKLQDRAEIVDARKAEKQEAKEARKAAKGTEPTTETEDTEVEDTEEGAGKPANPGSQGKGRQ